ncbi:MAG: DUF721 domain-containing protein [Bacteroidota bacterium]|nr:DUF721 domain-containing protein [Bacteroidota bacterium]MDX5431596.1 DUF721 domain-containing protein [Bacteroidota bacterium]MDX5470317.1 DUF721 domain-containing protein [Bacteroidota bacterium]
MSEFKPLGKVLEDLLHTYRLKSKVNEVNLVREWENVVGPLIAKKTEKILLKDGVLHITINSAPLKQELSYSKDQIMQLIEERFGKGYIRALEVH